MAHNGNSQFSTTFLLKELLFDVVRFPFWWYTRGLQNIGRHWLQEMSGQSERLSIGIWIRNLFNPMYGDRSFSGRMISFVLRIFVLIGRFIALLFWAVIMTFLLIFWIAIPPLITYAIIRQFS